MIASVRRPFRSLLGEGSSAVRTVLFIVGGLFLFGLLLFTTQRSDRAAVARTCLLFLGIWCLVAVGELIYSVTRAGDSLGAELAIAVVIFVPPAVPAAILWWKNRPR